MTADAWTSSPSRASSSLAPGDVVASDLEGTLTDGETWRGLGRWLAANGRRAEYRRFLAPRLLALPLARFGLHDRQRFRDRWIRDLVAHLAGLEAAEIAAIAAWIVEEELWPARRGPMLAELAAAVDGGARLVLVSGTYDPVLRAFAARIGAEGIAAAAGIAAESVGTPLRFEGGRFTGDLAGPVNTGRVKVERLARRIGSAPLGRAYGDSAADLALLEAAATPIAVTPDRVLGQIARDRGWQIVGATAAGAVTGGTARAS
jgi:HAD superfamily phosphoserine phosphatase-like hydrolase